MKINLVGLYVPNIKTLDILFSGKNSLNVFSIEVAIYSQL